jgi:hypothetical protein
VAVLYFGVRGQSALLLPVLDLILLWWAVPGPFLFEGGLLAWELLCSLRLYLYRIIASVILQVQSCYFCLVQWL